MIKRKKDVISGGKPPPEKDLLLRKSEVIESEESEIDLDKEPSMTPSLQEEMKKQFNLKEEQGRIRESRPPSPQDLWWDYPVRCRSSTQSLSTRQGQQESALFVRRCLSIYRHRSLKLFDYRGTVSRSPLVEPWVF